MPTDRGHGGPAGPFGVWGPEPDTGRFRDAGWSSACDRAESALVNLWRFQF